MHILYIQVVSARLFISLSIRNVNFGHFKGASFLQYFYNTYAINGNRIDIVIKCKNRVIMTIPETSDFECVRNADNLCSTCEIKTNLMNMYIQNLDEKLKRNNKTRNDRNRQAARNRVTSVPQEMIFLGIFKISLDIHTPPSL